MMRMIPGSRFSLAACLTVVLSMAASMPALAQTTSAPAAKAAVPQAAAIKAVQKTINDLYKIDSAKKPEEKAALAHKLMQKGLQENGDPAAKYVLLTMSKDMAVGCGGVRNAWAATKALCASFDVDSQKLRSDTLQALATSTRIPENLAYVIVKAGQILDESVLADDYKAANKLTDIITSAARASRNPDLSADAAIRQQRVSELQYCRAKLKPAIDALAINPNDPAANAAVGKFRCFHQGNWEAGLPALALGDDANLRDIAKKELAGPKEPSELITLGDLWLSVAAKEKGTSQEQCRLHAGVLYKKVLSEPEGLQRAYVLRKLKDPEMAKVRTLRVSYWPYSLAQNLEVTDEARKAAKAIVAYLWSRQAEDGRWVSYGFANLDHDQGPSALAALAILEYGVDVADPRMTKALKWIEQEPTNGTYDLAIRANLWLLADRKSPGSGYAQLLAKDVARMSSSHDKGTFSYWCKGYPYDGYDHSNTQFGVWGIAAGARGNLQIAKEFWTLDLAHWSKAQQSGGGWGYRAMLEASRQSMTAAGIASIAISSHESGATEANTLAMQQVKKAVAWLENDLTLNPSGGSNMYNLFVLCRTGIALRTDILGNGDWYRAGVNLILSSQAKSATRPSGDYTDAVSAAFSLYFLAQGMKGEIE